VVAGTHPGYAGADLLDDPGALMSAADRQGRGLIAEVVMDVAMAESGRHHADQNLVVLGRVDLYFAHLPSTG
jgi:hypothetical protein